MPRVVAGDVFAQVGEARALATAADGAHPCVVQPVLER
jgi:hypothetical protein